MFDFFKDAYVELNGLDLEKVEEEKKEKIKNQGLFKKSTRVIISVVGILYLFIAGLNIYNIFINGIEPRIVKYIFLLILDLFILATIHIKKKEVELMSLVAIILFILSNFLMTSL